MVDVVVIGQNYSTTLGVVKALSQTGYRCAVARCIAGVEHILPPDVKSKYVAEHIYLPRNDDDTVIRALIEKYGVSEKLTVIIPTDDYCASLIDKKADQLSPFFVFPRSLGEQGIISLMNKANQKKSASKEGILTARCRHISIQEVHLESSITDFSFPCIVKPIMSLGSSKTWIRCCHNCDDLLVLINEIKGKRNPPQDLLVEDYIDVEAEFTIPCLSLGKEVYIPAFIKKTIVAQGNHKGVTICGTVEDGGLYPSFQQNLIKLVKGFGVIGLLDIEAFFCQGKFYLNEVNLRNGAAGYSLTRAGINLPKYLVEYLLYGLYPDESSWCVSPLSFVNDKANLENHCSGYSSFRQYMKNIKDADMRLVVEKGDIPARVAFMKIEVVSLLKHLLSQYV